MKFTKILLTALLAAGSALSVFAQQKLTGTPYLPPDQIWAFAGEGPNQNAFDGNTDTYALAFDGGAANFLGYDLGQTQVLDSQGQPVLGADGNPTYTPNKAVITKIRWMSRNNNEDNTSSELGIFMGANDHDFLDAVPLYMIKTAAEATNNEWHEATVNVNKGFRYLKYVAPMRAKDANVTWTAASMYEIEFYGKAGEGDDTQYYTVTDLPTVIFNSTEAKGIILADKKDDTAVYGTASVIYEKGTKNAALNAQKTRLKERGNGSRVYPKKPWSIKFNKKVQMPGANKDNKNKKWTLIANYNDKTEIRNSMALDISEMFGAEYTTYHQPVDVIVNGVYWGSYLLCDQLEIKNGSIPGTSLADRVEDYYGKDNDAPSIPEELIDGDYHIEIDAYANQEAVDQWFQTDAATDGYQIPVTVKEPEWDPVSETEADPKTTQMYAYMKNHFAKFTKAVYDYAPLVNETYRDYLDLDSWFRHLLINDICLNKDGAWSIHMVKRSGSDKMYAGIVWDFDLALGNYTDLLNSAQAAKDQERFLFQAFPTPAGATNELIYKIMTDPHATASVANVMKQAKANGLSADWIRQNAQKRNAEVSASRELNYVVWDVNHHVDGTKDFDTSFEKEIEYLVNCVTDEFNYVSERAAIFSGDVEENLYTLQIEPLTGNGNLLRAGEETRLAARVYKKGRFTAENVPAIGITCDDPEYWDAQTGIYRMPDGAENHFAHFTATFGTLKAEYTVGTIDTQLYAIPAEGTVVTAEANEGNTVTSGNTRDIIDGGSAIDATGAKFVFADHRVDGYEATVTLTLPEAIDLGAIELIWDANPRIIDIKVGADVNALQDYASMRNYTDISGNKRQGYFKAAEGVKVIQIHGSYPSPNWGIQLMDLKLYRNEAATDLMISAARVIDQNDQVTLRSVLTDMQGNFTNASNLLFEAEHGSISDNVYTSPAYYIGYDTLKVTDGDGREAHTSIYVYPKKQYQQFETLKVTSILDADNANVNYALLFDGGDDILNAGRNGEGNQTDDLRLSPNLGTEESKDNASWIQFEFPTAIYFNHIAFIWEGASPEAFKVYVSDEPHVEAAPAAGAPRRAPAGAEEIFSLESRDQGGTVTDYITPTQNAHGKYLLVEVSKNHTPWGLNMYEAKVFGSEEERPTGVESIETTDEGEAEYFNFQGLRILNPEKGQILIRKQGSNVDKVIIR